MRHLTPQQFNELMVAETLEPITLRYVVQCLKLGFATLANLWCQGSPFKPDDFDPGADRTKTEDEFVSPNAGAAMFQTVIGVYGGQRR